MQKSLWIIPALLLIATMGAPAARADIYDWTISGPIDMGTGTFTTGPGSLGNSTITSISGVYDTQTITGLIITDDFLSAGGIYTLDPTHQFAFQAGSTFEFQPGGVLAFNPTFTIQSFPQETPSIHPADIIQIQPAVNTPEPGSAILMLSGVGLLGLMMLMRKRIARCLPQAR